MNDGFPRQPPLPQGPTTLPVGAMGMPAVVTVFGILHLVFAGLGVISAGWGLFIAVAGNPFLRLTHFNPQMRGHMDAQVTMQTAINPFTITASILSLLVAVPMVIAGVRMLMRRRNGLKWSNAYAWSSLGAKMINLVLTITIMVPAMLEMNRGIMAGPKMPGPAVEIMSMFMAGSAVGGVVISCIYPVMALIILNRPPIKEWFASQPN